MHLSCPFETTEGNMLTWKNRSNALATTHDRYNRMTYALQLLLDYTAVALFRDGNLASIDFRNNSLFNVVQYIILK